MKKSHLKRIATVFITNHPDTVGNANRLSRYQTLAQNYNLLLITNQPDFIKNKINAKILPVKIPQVPVFFSFVLWFIVGLRLLFLKYDLLFLVFSDAPVAFFNRKKPFLCHIHQSHEIIGLHNNKKKRMRIISNWIALLIIKGVKRANFCFAVSDQLVEFFKSLGVSSSKISCLPHGVDLDKFKRNLNENKIIKQSDKFILMYTGWVSENRGLDLMLEGIKEIGKANPNVYLVIVGAEENYIHIINEFIKNNNLENLLEVKGRVNYDEIPEYINHAHACLSFLENNKSYSISPPQKLFEYFALGKPVIANQIASHNSYITCGYNGILIKNLEVNLFKNAVLKLMTDKIKYEQMCENARVYANQFDMRLIERNLLNKIDSLLNVDLN